MLRGKRRMDEKKPIIIALCGKGGVGKTSLSALIVRILCEKKPDAKILAIDADPAVGLASALGVEVSSTVDDIRTAFIESVEEGAEETALEMLGDAKFEMMQALVERKDLSFLAIGRPESAGCYCKVNAYLKEIISMIADHFDYVVIDGEAGIEQVNRRVMEKVTHLILVSDASKKGLKVVKTIHEVAQKLVMYESDGLIINRIPDLSLREEIDAGDLRVLAMIPDDHQMSANDMRGNTVFELPDTAPIYQGAEEALYQIGILRKEGERNP